MIVRQVKVSEVSKDRLARLKGKTGIKNWNTLCRWAFCYSLAEGSVPTDVDQGPDSNVEMGWHTFTGEAGAAYDVAMIQWCLENEIEVTDANLTKYFKLHLERGIAHLSGTNLIKTVDDLLSIAWREE